MPYTKMGLFCCFFSFSGDDEVMGVEAVFDGVLAGDLFALFGYRAGGFPGVDPIGRQLFSAYGHISPLSHTFHLLGGNVKNH